MIQYLKSTHMSLSFFAQTINHPLCQYMDQIPFTRANPDKKPIRFLSGDPTAYGNDDFRMPQLGYDLMRKTIADGTNHGYTQTVGQSSTRAAVAKLYKTREQIPIDNVIIHHNANQGLMNVLMAFTNPGDEILVPEIGYPVFEKLAPAIQVKVHHYKLKSEKNFEIDLEHAGSLVNDRTQFIFVINPSNPMGTIFSLKHMQEILQFCDQHQLPLLADEVYHKQAFPEVEWHSFGEVTDDVPVIVMCGVQKLLSVPGWSTAWSITFDKHGYLDKIHHNIERQCSFFLHTNTFTMIALPQILQEVGLFTSQKVAKVKTTHDEISTKFNSMKGYKPIQANGTIYITITIDLDSFKDIGSDLEYVEKIIEEQNIVMLPLSVFGGKLHGFRLLTCGKAELYSEFFSRIEQFNQRHQ